jgi:hypothetical protein
MLLGHLQETGRCPGEEDPPGPTPRDLTELNPRILGGVRVTARREAGRDDGKDSGVRGDRHLTHLVGDLK